MAGGLQSVGSKRVGRNLEIKQQQYCLIHELLNKANYVFKFTWLNFIFFHTFMTSSEHNYLPKALLPNTITLGVRA